MRGFFATALGAFVASKRAVRPGAPGGRALPALADFFLNFTS